LAIVLFPHDEWPSIATVIFFILLSKRGVKGE